jgi:hypothetical protein
MSNIMNNLTSKENIEAFQELFETMLPLNLMFMITDNGFQVVDKNTDEEYNFTSIVDALELINEYQRHHEECKRLTARAEAKY